MTLPPILTPQKKGLQLLPVNHTVLVFQVLSIW